MKKIRRIYLAGPLTPRGHRITDDGKKENPAIEYLYNVRDMMEAAHNIIKLGVSVYCPGIDFPLFLVGNITQEEIYRQSIDWLEVSDALVLLDSFADSKGVNAEIKRAKELGIPILSGVGELESLLEKTNERKQKLQSVPELRKQGSVSREEGRRVREM